MNFITQIELHNDQARVTEEGKEILASKTSVLQLFMKKS
jgi:hypothetical protein